MKRIEGRKLELTDVEGNKYFGVQIISQTGIKEEVLDAANEYYNSLMDLRQVCGLGIKVSREVSEKTRISRTVRGE